MGTPREINRQNFKLGFVDVEPTRDLVIVNGGKHPVEPMVMDVLCILAEQSGEVVMRDEFIDRIWDADHGGDESLTRAVSVLRKTLREAGAKEKFIETIPKRGYRLTQDVDNSQATTNTESLQNTDILARNSGSILPVIILVLLAALATSVMTAIVL